MLIGATFFAYLVYPPIAWLERRRWPRWLAIVCVYIVLVLVLVLVIDLKARTFDYDYGNEDEDDFELNQS